MEPTLLFTTLGAFVLGAVVATSVGSNDKAEPEMAKIHGIGGIFFTSDDPTATQNWYVETLGIHVLELEGGYKIPLIQWRELDDKESTGTTVFSVFKNEAEHLSPSTANFMINYRVRDIEAIREQVKAGGGTLLGDIQEDFNGRFAWFLDPDGRKVELWEPSEGY